LNNPRRFPLLAAVCAVSVFGFVGAAQAHNWGCWIQPNRTVYTYNTAVLSSQASAALSDWDNKTILSIPRVSYHTEVSVFDGYYGNTGWAGIASIESSSGCNILHGHARVNRSYSYSSNGYRGIFCQEVGHLFGLDHSNDGGCMGGGYFYDINTYYTVVSHNVNDISTKYSSKPLAAAFPAATGERTIEEGHARAIAFWHERPRTVEEAKQKAETIVEAHVMQVVAGPDLTAPVPGLENDMDRIPTQRILFSVDRVISGTMNGRVFELFHTGNDEFTVEEDPAYAVGERYVLFLTTQERGAYRIIAPEGRLLVTDGGLVPSSTREFMSNLKGRSVESLTGDLSGHAGQSSGEPGLQLRRNAVNALTGRVSISYAIPQPAQVKLRLFDARGRLVRTLVDAQQDGPRWYTVEWDGMTNGGRSAPSGMFYAKLETPAGSKTLSLVRLK
jgi:hypothetical protein